MQATATTLENTQETAPVNSRNKVVVASLIGTAIAARLPWWLRC